MNTTDEEFVDDCGEGSLLDQLHVKIPVIILYGAVFNVCLFGNLFTLIVIVAHRSMRTSTNFFLANLMVADLLVALFCILQNMFHIVGSPNGSWPLGAVLCQLYVFFLHLVPCTSIGVLICVSLEKYIAVLHPLIALKILTPNLRISMMITIWCASILVNLPYYFTTKELRFGKIAACTRDFSSAVLIRNLVTISFFLWYCLPLVTLAYLYARIGIFLWMSASQGVININTGRQSDDSCTSPTWMSSTIGNGHVAESLVLMASSDQRKISHDANREVFEARKRVVRLLFAIVLSFAVLTLPHHARLLYMMWATTPMCNNTIVALLQPFTYLCLFISTSANPFLYAFFSRRFRDAVYDIVCRQQTRKQSAMSLRRTRTLVSECGDDSRTSSLQKGFRMSDLRPCGSYRR